MKVIIDGKPNVFVKIFHVGDHWQCNTQNHASAHNFNFHPKLFAKDSPVKTNGCTYIFPSQ